MSLSKARKASEESRCKVLLIFNPALYWCEWSATHPGFLTQRKNSDTHKLGDRVSQRAGLDNLEKKISCPGWNLDKDRPARGLVALLTVIIMYLVI